MFKKILLAIVLLLAVLLAFAATKPDTYTVSRSTTVNAPPARVFAIVNDLHNFARWSPWAHLDPAMKTSFSGAAAGAGAKYAWSGNKDVGSGSMEILESKPDAKVGMDLRFAEPFQSQARTDIDMAPEGAGSTVTWTINGKMNYIMKLMSVFMPMDSMMGRDFENGLANLKREAEAAR